MKKISLLFLVFLLSLKASADAVEIDGISYNLVPNGNIAEVTRLSGEKYSGDIVIPEKIKYEDTEYSVTSIGVEAFFQCGGLTSVTIPNSVTSIGSDAFEGCSGLYSINIPNNLTFIGEHAFAGCSNLISFTIPESVTYIGPGAFNNTGWYNNQSDGILYLDNWLIRWKGEKPSGELRIVDGTKGIVGRAFSGCSDLKIIYIPNSVISICSYAFLDCNGLTKIVSEISNPYIMEDNVFEKEIYNTARLIVPIGTKPLYLSTAGWNKFINIVESETPTIKRTIHVATAGTLKDYISDDEKYQIEDLTLTGELNGTDFHLIRDMAGVTEGTKADYYVISKTKGVLTSLDLTNATIVEGGKPYLTITDVVFARTLTRTGKDYVYSTKDNCITPGLFYYTNLKSIIIPSSVTDISDSAFENCSQLTSLVVGDGNKFFDSRDNCNAIINTDSNELIAGCNNTIIPNSVTTIGNNAFCGCSGLTSITIPNSVTSIGHGAFSGCKSLTSINIPDGVTNIGKRTFFLCSSLTYITIPNSVKSIGYDAFHYCRGLTSIAIPDGVTSIESGSFAECSGLTSINIPDGVTSIGSDAFYGCSGLTSIIIPNRVSSIGGGAFSNCSGLKSIHSYIEWPFKISESVFSETTYANSQLIVPKDKKWFYQNTEGWNKFKNIVESGDGGVVGEIINVDNVNYKIGENNTMSVTLSVRRVFDDDLGDLVIHDHIIYNGINYIVTSIEYEAFAMGTPATGLKSITIPNTIKRIGVDAFMDQYGMNAVYITDLEAWCDIIFDGNPRWSNPLSRAGHLYLNGEEIKDLVIPTGVTTINNGAFCGNTGLTSVSIPNGVISIGSRAFEGCTGLGIIHIGNGVKEIGEMAFANINKTKTGTRADEEGIEVYCYADDVPNTSEDAFDGTPTEKSTLYVPANSVEAYKSVWPWSDFKEIVPLSNDPLTDKGIIFTAKDDGTLEVTGLEDGTTMVDILSTVSIDGREYQVTSIGKRAFEGRDNIEYLSIPWSVTSIAEFAFIDCGNNMTVNIADPESWCQMEIANEYSSPLSHAKKVLVYDIETDQIDIPEGVTSIGKYTFYQCQCIKSLNIPATVTSIGSSAFEGCASLTSLSLSEGLESIGGSAFEGCTGLKNLVIPSTVNTISINAFKNCKGITDVYCYAENVPETDENAFDGTPTEKSTLHVPANAVESYNASWPWSDFKEIVALTGDDPNGILAVKQSVDKENLYYDLYGRRIHQPQLKGLYIRNGKKIVVK